MESGYYPSGTEFDSNAPWNQSNLPDKEIEVTICLSISKTAKIKVNDYKVLDEDNIDFSTCCLNEAVEKQIILPQNTKLFEDWNVDELEVINNEKDS